MTGAEELPDLGLPGRPDVGKVHRRLDEAGAQEREVGRDPDVVLLAGDVVVVGPLQPPHQPGEGLQAAPD